MEVAKRKKPYLKTFWTPSLANILFWFFALIFGISAGIAIASGHTATAISFATGILVIRVFFECAVILFQIHDVLVDIRSQGDGAIEKEQTELKARLQAARIAAAAKTSEPGEIRLG